MAKIDTLFMTKMAKIKTLFTTKKAEKPYPLGPHIPIIIAHIREYPSPQVNNISNVTLDVQVEEKSVKFVQP